MHFDRSFRIGCAASVAQHLQKEKAKCSASRGQRNPMLEVTGSLHLRNAASGAGLSIAIQGSKIRCILKLRTPFADLVHGIGASWLQEHWQKSDALAARKAGVSSVPGVFCTALLAAGRAATANAQSAQR